MAVTGVETRGLRGSSSGAQGKHGSVQRWGREEVAPRELAGLWRRQSPQCGQLSAGTSGGLTSKPPGRYTGRVPAP